jgi:hypothetical protein
VPDYGTYCTYISDSIEVLHKYPCALEQAS